jgi:hypothetical protein
MDVILDREELYRDVWSTTVSAVARKYNLTDFDIRKACFALDVPTPVQGYWAKVRAGNPPPIPSLPRKRGASTFTCRRDPSEAKGAATVDKAKSPSISAQSSQKKPTKPKESIVDGVRRDNAELAAEKAKRSLAAEPVKRRSRHELPAEELAKHPRYVPLAIWAQLLLGEYAPHQNTLLRWVHDGRIQPQPKKMGRYWVVRVDAEYVPD